MTQINQLTAQDEVTASDQFPLWSGANGDTRRASAAAMKAFFAPETTRLVTAYAAPNATGFTVALDGTDDVWLILTPSALYDDGTIVLPASPRDKQLVTVSCSQALVALVVSGNGNTVRGAPEFLAAANAFFSLRFDDVTNVWVRVG